MSATAVSARWVGAAPGRAERNEARSRVCNAAMPTASGLLAPRTSRRRRRTVSVTPPGISIAEAIVALSPMALMT